VAQAYVLSPDIHGRVEPGTDSACIPGESADPHPQKEEPIRTLSVSLLAVAAIAASLLLSRAKPERTTPDGITPADQPAEKSLDEIRAAGL
jgi:hypothetical protein